MPGKNETLFLTGEILTVANGKYRNFMIEKLFPMKPRTKHYSRGDRFTRIFPEYFINRKRTFPQAIL